VATNTSKQTGAADFSAVVDSFARDPLVSNGKMFGSVALKVNGKVFAMLVKGDLVVKLPRTRVDHLVTSGAGRAFDPGHGKVMKEWVCVPAGRAAWCALAKEACGFVAANTPR
jgi:hypothetical protein